MKDEYSSEELNSKSDSSENYDSYEMFENLQAKELQDFWDDSVDDDEFSYDDCEAEDLKSIDESLLIPDEFIPSTFEADKDLYYSLYAPAWGGTQEIELLISLLMKICIPMK